jgi:hypothetical protein
MKYIITESHYEKINSIFNTMPKLKDLKPYGLKYSVKALKNLLVKKTRPDGTFGDNKWTRDEMPFPEELDILNTIFQSKIAQFYFIDNAKKKDKYDYNWANLISKEDLDNFPLPEHVFNLVVNILTNTKR